MGRAVAKILCENGRASLRLTHICNRNVERKKQAWVPSDVIWTDDVESVLKSDVDIVIELIGGLNPAEQIVRTRARVGKVGGHGEQATDCAPRLRSVCNWLAARDARSNSAPRSPAEFRCFRRCAPGLCGDRLHGIAGILNGTCNYILSRIENARIPFSEALEEAQARGLCGGRCLRRS